MVTKVMHIDGAAALAVIIRSSAYTNGVLSPAIQNPASYPEDVYFHTSLNYLEPDMVASNAAGVSITFPQRDIVYYTWDDASHGHGGGC